MKKIADIYDNIFSIGIASAEIGFLKKYHAALLISIIIMALVIVLLVFFLIALIRKNKDSKDNAEETYSTVVLTKPIDDPQTMTVYGGETEVLLEENKKFEIVLTDRSNPEIRYNITCDEAVMGRNKDISDIAIENEKSISQRHCKIFVRRSSVYISDLDSLNHTYVDGEMISDETEIVSGSELRLGRKIFTVEISEK